MTDTCTRSADIDGERYVHLGDVTGELLASTLRLRERVAHLIGEVDAPGGHEAYHQAFGMLCSTEAKLTWFMALGEARP